MEPIFFPLNRAFAFICYTHSGTIGAVMVWFVIKLGAACTEYFGDIIRIRWLWHPRLPHLNPCNRSTRWTRLKIKSIVILLALKTIWKKASHYSIFLLTSRMWIFNEQRVWFSVTRVFQPRKPLLASYLHMTSKMLILTTIHFTSLRGHGLTANWNSDYICAVGRHAKRHEYRVMREPV